MSYNQPPYDYGLPSPNNQQNYVYEEHPTVVTQGHLQTRVTAPRYVHPMAGRYMGTPRAPPPDTGGYDTPEEFLTDPLMTNVALKYGSKLVGSGKSMVDKELGKYIVLSSLKYYFAVDTQYVLGKLRLLLFPFTHKDWFLKYDQKEPLQPRHDINAPDLYIPTMAYVTYVLVAGLVLGTQNRFSPEVLGILASQTMAWTFAEIIVQIVTLYICNIETNLKTFDLLAFAGYKFVGIILAVLSSLLFGQKGYYVVLVYCSITLAFFMVRTLKFQVLVERDSGNLDDGYSSPSKSLYTVGNKRRMYFILSIAISQPLLMWWFSYHLMSV